MDNTDKSVFPKVDREQMPDFMQAIWNKSMQRRGEAHFIEAAAHAPGCFNWYMERFYKELFYQGQVPVKLKELGRLRLSLEHGCKTCNQGNRLDALDAGLSERQINNLTSATKVDFCDQELSVIKLAEQIALTNPNGTLTEELYRHLRQHFSDGEIFELGMVLGLLAGMAKFMFAFDIVVKEETCPF